MWFVFLFRCTTLAVQNAFQVKITDFGLAKLLDYNEEEFHAKSGKVNHHLLRSISYWKLV